MIYLDAGATTLEKPACVREAMARAVQTMTSPGRGGHSAVRLAEQTAFRCRSEAAALFGAARPEQVIFTQNATHGLNIAIRTLVRPGSRVAISGYEHNAVTRVLHSIPDVAVTVVDAPLFDPDAMAEGFAQALAQGADAAVCNHVSNVFGAVAPVAEIAALCHARGVPLIVDASQSAGVLEVNLTGWGAAFAAMPGHKGLYGPQGTGLLLCAAEAEPLLFGGTGSQSRRQEMPQDLPDRLEAGTHNMPGIAGLLEGIRFVRGLGTEEIARRERQTARRASELLREVPGVEVFAREDFAHQTGVLSFRVRGMDCEMLGEQLAARGIAVRAGLHCAPLAHRTAGTLETGTVRISPSVFTSARQVERFAAEVQQIVRENVRL